MKQNDKNRLTIYGSLLNQPTRTVTAFCQYNNISHEFKNINLARGEQFSKEFKKINPRSQVPTIKFITDEGKDFCLDESVSIIRFLASAYKTNDKLYPNNDILRRAKIDLYLDWHLVNTRPIISNAGFIRAMTPKTGVGLIILDTYERLPKLFKYFDTILEGKKYIVDNEISIADIFLVSEINQLNLIVYMLYPYKRLYNYIQEINNLEVMKYVNREIAQIVKMANF